MPSIVFTAYKIYKRVWSCANHFHILIKLRYQLMESREQPPNEIQQEEKQSNQIANGEEQQIDEQRIQVPISNQDNILQPEQPNRSDMEQEKIEDEQNQMEEAAQIEKEQSQYISEEKEDEDNQKLSKEMLPQQGEVEIEEPIQIQQPQNPPQDNKQYQASQMEEQVQEERQDVQDQQPEQHLEQQQIEEQNEVNNEQQHQQPIIEAAAAVEVAVVVEPPAPCQIELVDKQVQFDNKQDQLVYKTKAIESEAYTNKLEKSVHSLQQSLRKSRNQQTSLRQKNLQLDRQLQASKQTVMELRRKKLEFDSQKKRMERQIEQLKKSNTQQQQRLAQIQKVGNILVLKAAIQDMQLLTDNQKQEIEQLKQSKEETIHSYYNQQLSLLEEYQTNMNTLKEQNNRLVITLQKITSTKDEILQLKLVQQAKATKLQQNITELQKQKASLLTTIQQWQKKWQSNKQQRSQRQFERAEEEDRRIVEYQSERYMGQQNDVKIIPLLTDKEERNLLLKQYLKLQTLFEENKIRLEKAETDLKKALRTNRLQQTQVIRKKDYVDLLEKYRKAKSCLQGVLKKLKHQERNQINENIVRQQICEVIEGNQSRRCQTVIKQVGQSQQILSQKIYQMQINDQLLTLKNENTKYKQNEIRMIRQIKSNQRLLLLLNDEVESRKKVIQEKSKTIQNLLNNGYHINSEKYKQKIAILEQQVSSLSQALNIFEIKNLNLIKQNEKNIRQINHWKSLYDNIKVQLSQKISGQLAFSEAPAQKQQQQISDFSYCRECEKRTLNEAAKKQYNNQEVQTQTLYDLHFKQIKQTLICLKRINKEIDSIPQNQQKTVKIITDFKEKYEKYVEKYNSKLLQLRRQKAQNEAWRNKTKIEIRDQFQDIRELINNNRLATALRQAKSLIDYLQNEQQKNQEEEKSENNGEEMEEEHKEA